MRFGLETLRQVYGAVFYVAVGALVVLFIYQQLALNEATDRIEQLADGIDATTTQIRDTQKSSRSILDYINDCTEPTGKCYQASEARDAEQAGAYNAAVIAAAWCISLDPATHRELTQCVVKILDGKGHK